MPRLLAIPVVVGCVLALSAQALPARADESPPTLTPAQGPPGTKVTATATDWTGCSSMSVIGWGKTLATASISSAGAFSLPFTVPGDAAVGATQLQFSPTCSHSAISPFVTFTVTAPGPGTGASAPAAPSNLAVTAVDPHDIKLTWRDNSSDEAGFEINNGVVSRNAGANNTTYTWGGLAPGTYMCFKIRSYNNAGSSAWEPNVSPWYRCATTPNSTPPKSCPTVLLGLHGMNEGPSATKAADIASTVESTFVFFKSIAANTHKFSPSDYQVQDVPYPTTGFTELDNPFTMRTIVSDVVDGSKALDAAVRHYTTLCATSNFELVGYSEGAWVVDYWLHFHSSEARKHVKAIQLYGDPNYYKVYRHDRHGVHAYRGLSRLAGLTFGWYGPPYPNPNAGYPIKSACIFKDPVCGKGYTESLAEHALQFGTAATCTINSCHHLDYVIDGYTKRGAEFLAKYAF